MPGPPAARSSLGGAGAAAAGVGRRGRRRPAHAATATGAAVRGAPPPTPASSPSAARTRPGITTAAQDRLHFVALDVITDDAGRAARPADPLDPRRRADDGRRRGDARRRRRRRPVEGARGHRRGARPRARPPHRDDRLRALALRRPVRPRRTGGPRRCATCRPSPATTSTRRRCGGDLCIQACSDDPQVAVHAVRNLVRMGFGVVSVRWSQLGFGRTSSTSPAQTTPRNLFGFKDGTANIKAEDTAALDEHVWVAPADVPGGAAWMAGGSYLVARRIRMHIEVWDRSPLVDQEQTIGRDKRLGAPLGPRRRVRRARLRAPPGIDGEPRDPGRRARPARAPHPTSAACGSCAAATTSPTAATARATSTPGCSSSRSSATRTGSSCRCSRRWRGVRRPQRVHRAHRLGAVRLPARPGRRTPTGAPSSSPDASPT